MPSRAQRERSDRRRALRLLAGTPEGVTEALMLVQFRNRFGGECLTYAPGIPSRGPRLRCRMHRP
jgi:hypothetical protein